VACHGFVLVERDWIACLKFITFGSSRKAVENEALPYNEKIPPEG
jgi:hypothetical protein